MIERPPQGCNMTTRALPRADANIDAMPVLAEEVRAFLVTARGGAPFLSAADGRLLVSWLDEGVPVTAVLAAIERVAKRRAGRRMRTRLTLGACKSEVKKLVKRTSTPTSAVPRGAEAVAGTSLGAQIASWAAVPVPSELTSLRSQLVEELRAASTSPDSTAAAMACVRRFHERHWEATAAEHASLRRAARDELAGLEEVVSAKVFADLLDEHVRQTIRGRVSEFTVERLWTALGTGVSS